MNAQRRTSGASFCAACKQLDAGMGLGCPIGLVLDLVLPDRRLVFDCRHSLRLRNYIVSVTLVSSYYDLWHSYNM